MADTKIPELEARLAAASASPVDHVKKIDAMNELAWELRSSETARTHALAKEARELAIEHGYTLGQARAVRTMAMSVSDVEGVRSIFGMAEEAKRLFDEADDGAGRAASRDFLASIHEHIGDLSGAMEFALDALSIAREIGDPIRQGYALSNVGGILAALGEVDKGIERLEQALAFFQSADELTGIGTIASRLSRILRGAGRHEGALKYAEMVRDVAEAKQDEYSRFSALTLMAELEDERGDLQQAEALYRAALDCLKSEIGKKVVGAEARVPLARLLIKRGALDEAEVELTEALGRVKADAISIVTEAETHEVFAELRERRDQLSAAIEHLRAAQALREEISQKDARSKLAQVEARAALESAKKDAEIHKLRFVELHGMQSKLVEAEKMALLGKLAAGTAHELNTPLGVLRSNVDLSATAAKRLVALVADDDDIGVQATKLASVLESCRETSDEAMERIVAITQSLRRFSELDKAALRSFDVKEGVESALALLEPTISAEIKVERRLEQVPAIEGWPRELNHAFMTVLQNAAHAIDGAGVVSVETSATDDYVLVRVRDTGRGMSEDQVAHLFDVAWSEEGTRTRMRLGLSAAYTTMQKHAGTIEVQSALGEGTTVTFRFPIPRVVA